MANLLTIDQGNTATKATVWQSGTQNSICSVTFGDPRKGTHGVCTGTQTGLDVPGDTFVPADTAQAIARLCQSHDIDAAIYCSVTGHNPAVVAALNANCGCVKVLDNRTPVPLKIAYDTPATLGMDRVAAAAGAMSLDGCRGHALLVADVGTAVTYDRVTADGVFLGGNIAPGIHMRLQALHAHTARLPMVQPCAGVPVWGTDTRSALIAGAVRGVVAELQYYAAQTGPGARTVVTGGSAHLLEGMLPPDTVICPGLVGLGLLAILRHALAHDRQTTADGTAGTT